MSLSRGRILVGSMCEGWPGMERTETASGRLWCRAEEPVPEKKEKKSTLAKRPRALRKGSLTSKLER
eukprot:257145-Pelagomonas_calceolata.AAC.1